MTEENFEKMPTQIYLFALLIINNVDASGMLYPRFSETRTIIEMNGMWKFRADMSPTRNEGFLKKWYTQPLSQVLSMFTFISGGGVFGVLILKSCAY